MTEGSHNWSNSFGVRQAELLLVYECVYVIHAVLVSSLCNGELPTITATPLIENVSNKTNEKTNESNCATKK